MTKPAYYFLVKLPINVLPIEPINVVINSPACMRRTIGIIVFLIHFLNGTEILSSKLYLRENTDNSSIHL